MDKDFDGFEREKVVDDLCYICMTTYDATIPNVLIGSLLMVATSAVVAVIVSRLYGFSSITAFLAVAPGGIAEMCLAGLEMNENVAVILTYQLIRVIMLNVVVPLGIRKYFGDGTTGAKA